MTCATSFRSWSLFAIAAGGLLAFQPAARAQQIVLPGRVLGPAGEAVPGLDVLLHRVTDRGGALLAQSKSGADGRFELRADGPADAAGVYFVAARFDGRLYIGPMLKPPFGTEPEYVLEVGVGAASDVQGLLQSARSDQPAAAGQASPGGVFTIVMLVTAIAAGAFLAMNGVGPSPARRARIRLAQLDEAGAEPGAPPAPLARKRRALVHQAIDAS